ncbi:hypothetical protein DESC_700109 [Desulfosarcina cetonica]|nr:hypothetical protein DESC_700109 [Desulfosarcina cetonica]
MPKREINAKRRANRFDLGLIKARALTCRRPLTDLIPNFHRTPIGFPATLDFSEPALFYA